MPNFLELAAWQVLRDAWLVHIFAITLLGALPAELLGRVSWLRGRTWAQSAKRIFSGIVVVLCLASSPLAYDTYLVESRDMQAFSTSSCVTPSSRGTPIGNLTCVAERPVTVDAPSGQPEAGHRVGQMYRLAHYGAPVLFVAENTFTP
jgi:hypothetical protein